MAKSPPNKSISMPRYAQATPISVMWAYQNFDQLLDRVHYDGECFLVMRSGKPMVYITPVQSDP